MFTALGNDIAGPTLFSLWFPFLSWQLQEYLRRMLYTRGFVLNVVINTIIANGVRLLLMVVWMQQGKLSGIAGLDAIAWGSFAALIPASWFTRRYWRRDFLGLKETWEKNWRFGHWILGGSIANWVSVEFYPILTAGLISFAAAGAYRALQNIVAPIHTILRAMDTFLTPRTSRIYAQSGVNSLVRTMKLAYIFAGIPTLGFLVVAILFPEILLELLYGDTYLAYAQGMVLMAIFYGFWFAYWPLQIALKAVHLSRPIFIANMAAILLMFSVGAGMILRWGVYGTIGGQILNALIVNIVLWFAWLTWRKTAR